MHHRQILRGLLVVFCLIPMVGNAQTGEQPFFEIAEFASLDFGAVLNESGRVTLPLLGESIIDPSSIHLGGFYGLGVYRIKGDPFASFVLEVIPFGGRGLRLVNMQTSAGNGGFLPVQLDESGQLEINIGGSLEVDPQKVQTGVNQPLQFVISVTWE